MAQTLDNEQIQVQVTGKVQTPGVVSIVLLFQPTAPNAATVKLLASPQELVNLVGTYYLLYSQRHPRH